MFKNIIHNEDCLTGLKKLPDNSIDCCITSPPYYGLRDYGNKGQIGLEETPDEYILKLVDVFNEVKRVLKKEGTLWLNIGDSYNGSNQSGGIGLVNDEKYHNNKDVKQIGTKRIKGLKPKDLIGIPWLVAFALRGSGWYLRQDIIWHKPNPMPESVTDRCTKAHEYIFLLSKSPQYYYDAESIKTDAKPYLIPDRAEPIYLDNGRYEVPGQSTQSIIKTKGRAAIAAAYKGYDHSGHSGNYDATGNLIGNGMANKRSVWVVNTMPYSEAHFATFPERLIIDCIKAGCPENGLVLDPFMGAGTTALVARKLNRNYIGFELNENYIKIAEKRLKSELGFFE